MCRSRSTLAIFAAISTALVPISIIMLIVENTSDQDAFTCPHSSGLCYSCDEVTSTQATISSYLAANNIDPVAYGYPLPVSEDDWPWFYQYICVDYVNNQTDAAAAAASSSSSGSPVAAPPAHMEPLVTDPITDSSVAGNMPTEMFQPQGDVNNFGVESRQLASVLATASLVGNISNSTSNVSTTGVFASIHACCCGTSPRSTTYLTCPLLAFRVTVWSWLWFILLVAGANCVLLSILGYVFLECGCIESSKGPLELIADDLHLRRTEGR